MVATPEEQKKILEILKKEGLEEFFESVAKAWDHNKALEHLIEKKNLIKSVIEKYENGNDKIAFEKAPNNGTYIYISHDVLPEVPMEPLEMSFEEFVSKFKPNLIWHRNGKGTYSALLGKYRFFAKNYKVIIFKIPSTIDDDAIRIATKISKNIYPISRYSDELSPRGFVIFVPN